MSPDAPPLPVKIEPVEKVVKPTPNQSAARSNMRSSAAKRRRAANTAHQRVPRVAAAPRSHSTSMLAAAFRAFRLRAIPGTSRAAAAGRLFAWAGQL